jgi:hypothetical protein
MTSTSVIRIDVSPGEVIDKITILEIKQERISDPNKRTNVTTELQLLGASRDQAIPTSQQLTELTRELKLINEELWDIEDNIRDCERNSDFGSQFIQLARAVYRTNDRRSEVKRAINELLGSQLIEEKSYAAY